MKYRVAVLGAGNIAGAHLKAIKELQDRLEAVAVADVNPERLNDLADLYGMNKYTDYKEMIVKEKPDIAIVALPPFLHKEAAVFCANEGCHIMLEKPMALNVTECDDIIAAAERNQIKLMVGHTMQYLPASRKVKQLITEGGLGELIMIHDVRHADYFTDARLPWSFEKAKAGGGILYNLGSHSIDKIQSMTESKVQRIRSSLSYKQPRRGDIEGGGVIFLETDKGIPATITQSGYKGVGRNDTEYIFTQGMIKQDSRVFISRDKQYVEVELDAEHSPLALQLLDLMESIETGREPECSGAYGKSVIQAIEAVYESDRLQSEIVLPS